MALDCIVIVTKSPILEPVFKGGAQRVLCDTYKALQSISRDCIVLQPGYQDTLSTCFHFASHVADNKEVLTEQLSTDQAISLLREADLTISVDNLLDALPQGHWHVLSLSNLAYDTERKAVRRRGWDRIWVPSKFLCDVLVHNYDVQLEKIHVIPPTLDFHSKSQHKALGGLSRAFERDRIPLSRRVLFPHRSDPAKGILSAIALMRRLIHDDDRWRLIVTAPSRFDDTTNHEFFKQVLEKSSDVREHLIVVPWLPHNTMSYLYSMSGCTIVASRLPESFGLAAAESTCAGTPVVALEAGALSRKHSELHDIQFVDVMDSESTANVVRKICGTRISSQTIAWLHNRFSSEVHLEAVRNAVASLQETI